MNTPEQIARAQRLQQTSSQLEREAQQATRVPPDVLAAPFSVQPTNTVPAEPSAIGFFAPAVVVLLLQHIAVSLASLSMVPLMTLRKSMPSVASRRAISMPSVAVNPPGRSSSTAIRRPITNSPPTRARIARTTSVGNRSRRSKSPPHSSSR